jgi:hypothetical protein
MRWQTGHPDTEALANFLAGLISGISGRRIAAHIARCERCEQLSDQLSAVTRALSSAPAPPLPDAIEQRIGASIAAEAAARRVASLARSSMADAPSAADPLAPACAAARSAANGSSTLHSPSSSSPRPKSPRRALGAAGARLRLSPVRILIPVTACLLLAGLGYLLSVPWAAGLPSSARSASTPRAATMPGNASINHGPHRDVISPSGAAGSIAGSRSGALFLVTISAIRYRKSTLRAQVISQLAVSDLAPDISPTPAITGTPGSGNNGENSSDGRQGTGEPVSSPVAFVPLPSLVGCVMNLTRHVIPAFVQRATYQATPAYVIAVPDKAWVVGLSCTAAKPALITSVSLVPAG